MKNKPLILGHRGYRAKFPENTILAFTKAYKYGADGIECDVQKTKDGEYIIFHDGDLFRITNRNGYIGETSYRVIKKLDAGRGQNIPHINEFLDSLPHDRFINIELKEETMETSDCPVILEMLLKRGLKDNILISSFKYELLPLFKNSGYKTGLLFDVEHFENGILKPVVNVLKYRPWSVDLPVLKFTGDALTPILRLFLLIMKLLRIKIIYWTVNTDEQYDAVSGYAHSIITDNVELMVDRRGGQN